MARINETVRKRMVWRISERNPKGEWVEAGAAAEVQAAPSSDGAMPEITFGGWVMSSFDLLKGLDVNDSHGTVPAELFDELFQTGSQGAEPPKR